MNGNNISAELAVETLRSAVRVQKPKRGLIIHSDQGSQFSSKEFGDFCKDFGIQQSMSRAGCLYDNAPMERYYNTLKNEYSNLFSFKTKNEMDQEINQFTYEWYNKERPHTYNNGLPPARAREA